MQNRYQNYSRNEPAPDMAALTMIDPKTGRPQQAPAPAVPPTKGPGDIHSAYGRRTPPRWSRTRSKSWSPPRTSMESVKEAPKDPRLDAAGLSAKNTAPVPDSINLRKDMVCEYWRQGKCVYTANSCRHSHAPLTCYFWKNSTCCKTADKCNYAHDDTGVYAPPPPGYQFDEVTARPADASILKRNTTCYFWRTRGECTKTQCEFAHHDTGVYAGEPGTFRGKFQRRESLGTPVDAEYSMQWQPQSVMSEVPRPANEAIEPYTGRVPRSQAQHVMEVNPKPENVLIKPPYGHVAPDVQAVPQQIPTTTPQSPSRDPRLRNRPAPAVRPPAQSPSDFPVFPSPGIDDAVTKHRDPRLTQPIDQEREFRVAITAVPKLDYKPLVESKNNGIVNHVFVQVPKWRTQEMKLIKDRFDGFNCHTWWSKDKDHWEIVKRFTDASVVIIVHPTENFCGTMPGLHQFLSKGSTINVWSIGVQHSLCIMEGREPAYEAQRLFPMGGITFITDDVFVYYPELATQIIEDFYNDAKDKPEGRVYSKIGARPGIKDWLQGIVQRKWTEDSRPDEEKDLRWIKCLDMLDQLCPVTVEDPQYMPEHSVPLEHAWLWSTYAGDMPDLEGMWESGDEEATTDYMVEHFAAEACINAAAFRRWIVVHQRPGQVAMGQNSQGAEIVVEEDDDPRRWKEKFSHIGVISADRYLQGKK